jgi:CheY-like chemotaxis protein
LLVEDHGVTARMIQMVLSARGHKVEMAGDVATALDLATRCTFDLLLSDLGLPDGSGHDLIRELRAKGYDFPGIALTGYGQEDDIQRSYEAGFAAHLIKPASRESVIEAVESIVASDGRPALDSSTGSRTDLPVFDARAALERCYGRREMLEEMIKIFPEESTELLSQMHMALANGSISEIGRAAHRLKGTVVFLGAQPASNAALAVEQSAKSGDLAAAAKAIADLEHQIELLRKVLDSYDGFS